MKEQKRILSLTLALVMALTFLFASALSAEAKVDVTDLSGHKILAQLPETIQRPVRPTTLEQAEGRTSIVRGSNSIWALEESKESVFQRIVDLTDDLTAGKDTDTQKVKAIYDWVSQNVKYDQVASRYFLGEAGSTAADWLRLNNASDPFSTYIEKLGVCDGYASLCWLMCSIAEVPAAYISGEAQRGGPHAWNAVLADGEWIFFDATWSRWDMAPDYHRTSERLIYCDGLFQVEMSADRHEYWLCDGYKSITEVSSFPSGATSVWAGACSGCASLTDVTIPAGMTGIGESAFSFCDSLTSVTIPVSVTSIERDAFFWCDSLQDVYYAGSQEQWEMISIGPENDDLTSAVIHYDGSIQKPTGSESSFEIKNGELIEYKGLDSSVTIPVGVTSIGYGAFNGCPDLRSVTIPDSVTSIGESAFASCDSLTSVTIGNGVTSIGETAFYECSKLTDIVIPASVTTIGHDAFYGCTGLTNVTISNGVSEIGSGAFDTCTALTNVTIPGSVTEVGHTAFGNCTGLTNVTICEGVTRIAGDAFHGCTELTGLTIPNGVTEIGERAFSGCRKLASMTIPSSVTNIGQWAFQNCVCLTDIYYGGTEAQWDAYSEYALSNDVTSSEYDPLAGRRISPTIHYNSPIPSSAATPATLTATPTNDALSVDGEPQVPTAYKIGGANYFQLRDVAMLLNGTKGQFSVDYDNARKAVTITTGQPYTPLGTELAGAASQSREAIVGNNDIYINGVKVDLPVYKIGGANYFKIRDLGENLGFNVGWAKERGMFIESDKPYTDAD